MVAMRGKVRRVAAASVLAAAIVVTPALGAYAANTGTAGGYSREEIHAHKDSHPGAFAWYRANGVRHNVGHHDHHHSVTSRRPI